MKKLIKILKRSSLGFFIIPSILVSSCTGFNSKLFGYKEEYDDSEKVYKIHLDAFYKQSPLWNYVVKESKKKLKELGLEKFQIYYTEQDVENYTKDKMSQLGYTDSTMPDIFRLSYGDISIMNTQRSIMPFPEKWIKDLKLDVNNKSQFSKTWGGQGVKKTILRGTPDRNGNIDEKNIQYIGLPYSLNTSVMSIRNSLTNRVGDGKASSLASISPSNINSANTISFLKKIKSVGKLMIDPNVNSSNFNTNNNKIPSSYDAITKIMKNSASNKGKPMIDIYGKHVFIDKNNNMVRFDGNSDTGTQKYKRIIQNGTQEPIIEQIKLTEPQLIKDANYNFYYTDIPDFFNRMDIWSELGQMLGIAIENDKKERTNKRNKFLWSEQKNGNKSWHYILKEADNPGVREAFKIIFDQIQAQSSRDKSWYDPSLRIDASFYNLTKGSRLFPITGAWDVPVVEKKFMEYALNISTDDQLKKIYDTANKEARKELDRIKDEATTFESLTKFKTWNNIPVTPFAQISIVAVNGRIGQKEARWNPEVKGKDGKYYSKKDVILMILKEFVSDNASEPTIDAQQVSPLKISLRDKITKSPKSTGNYKDYFDAQTPIIKTGIGGPTIQFWYELQAITDTWMINDIRTALTLSPTELKENFKKQKNINQNSGVTINSPIDEIRFQYAYNILIDKLDTDIRTKVSLTNGDLV